MHFKPVYLVVALAVPGILGYWFRANQKNKTLEIQDTLVFAGNLTGFASALWLAGAGVCSILFEQNYFNDTHYSLCVVAGLAVSRHFFLKVKSIWQGLNTPNVDDKLSSPDGGAAPSESRPE